MTPLLEAILSKVSRAEPKRVVSAPGTLR
jgi:hypothetical protein